MKALNRIGLLAGMMAVAACGGGSTDPGGGPGPGGNAEWTVMVYMAADNSLAVQGILDLDEMEDAGVDSKVNVVVQAEFNPDVLSQYQCDAACFNRPNFNTFRYSVEQAGGSAKNGPDRGPVQDIGNVDMTNPATLSSFIQWAKQNHPANHYLLVLWNHGGGYAGLLQDQTSAGSGLMSLQQLKTALTGAGQLDVVDFDMCLMAGYETLSKLVGLADFAVLSEEVVPGEGNPYTSVIDAIQATPTMSAQTLASTLVDRFNTSYLGNKASTTKSAYDMTGFAAFETALNSLAGDLQAGLGGGLGATISQAASASQKFSYTELTDVVSFLDSLNVRVAGQTALQLKIADVRAQALSPTFRVISRARNGGGSGQQAASDVARATGLHIVLPSGAGSDNFNATGPQSLTAYQTQYPGKAWTSFLTAYSTGGGQTANATIDQGDGSAFESYLVWDQAAIAAGADIDFWVLEPDGNIYIPAFGSVSANGTLSNDSYADGVNFEGYLTNRVIQTGTYKIYANLWRDPNDHRPIYDLAYRLAQSDAFTLLLTGGGGEPDTLSTDISWLNDPNPTLANVEAGAYTDLKYVAFSTFLRAAPGSVRRPGQGGAATARSNRHEITPAQIATIRRLSAARVASGSAPSRQRFGQPMPFPRGGH
ncbi:MAG: clostripain-related cysteine peptidase [Gemmatimonadota bacterium]